MHNRLGIMLGRLSAMEEGKIQSFPKNSWQNEYALAAQHGFSLLEWVLDYETAEQNPLLTTEGRIEMNRLSHEHGILTPSLCCDYFMEAPFFSSDLQTRLQAKGMLVELICHCPDVGIHQIELPLIGKSSVEDGNVRRNMAKLLRELSPLALANNVEIVLELSLPPDEVASFINSIGDGPIGINYDMGNSAYWGFDTKQEFAAYGPRIANVHIKDCTPEDYSVPLGQGNVDFDLTFSLLNQVGYKGDFVLQTARSNDEIADAQKYKEFSEKFLQEYLS